MLNRFHRDRGCRYGQSPLGIAQMEMNMGQEAAVWRAYFPAIAVVCSKATTPPWRSSTYRTTDGRKPASFRRENATLSHLSPERDLRKTEAQNGDPLSYIFNSLLLLLPIQAALSKLTCAPSCRVSQKLWDGAQWKDGRWTAWKVIMVLWN